MNGLTNASPSAQIGLLEAEPVLGRFLNAQEQGLLRRLPIPRVTVAKGPLDIEGVLEEAEAFAAIVLDGMVVQDLSLGPQRALRISGPGEVLSAAGSGGSALISLGEIRAVAPTEVVLLGRQVMLAARRVPRLLPGLQLLMAQQSERLLAQMVICQMPRVEDRVLALLWQLAETWGRITTSGTLVPLNLTHDAIGELIGARRSTVTLALRDLVERGALVRQSHGWLLLEDLGPTAVPISSENDPELLTLPEDSGWRVDEREAPDADPGPEALLSVIRSLRREHQLNQRRVGSSLQAAAAIRERNRALREEIRQRRQGTDGLRNGLHHDQQP